jgi:chemotaxis protein MotA
MDIAGLVGVTVAFASVFVALIMEGASPMAIMLLPALILIFFGSAGAALASGTLPGAIGGVKWLIYALKAKNPDVEAAVDPLVKLAERARREGLLALEQELEHVDDPFMKRGLQMAVDGTDPDDLYEILNAEVKAKRASAASGAAFWTDAGGYSPTIGIIGTVLGLIHVLENLSQPEKLGPLIAGAFVATLWGVLSANIFFLPFGKRIKAIGNGEALMMEVIIDGVLAIQSGANPRVVATRLRSKTPAPGPTSSIAREAA